MRFDQDELRPVITRLKRAHGHLGTVIRMREEGAECEDVLTQLAAVNKAVTRSGYAIVAAGWEFCRSPGGPGDDGMKRLEKLFMAFA